MTAEASLACCHSYVAVATDGPCGSVETPLFPSEGGAPDYLVLRTGSRVWPRFPVLPVSLVAAVADDRQLVLLRVSRDELERLPEELPIAM